jgi:hypothetical protein
MLLYMRSMKWRLSDEYDPPLKLARTNTSDRPGTTEVATVVWQLIYFHKSYTVPILDRLGILQLTKMWVRSRSRRHVFKTQRQRIPFPVVAWAHWEARNNAYIWCSRWSVTGDQPRLTKDVSHAVSQRASPHPVSLHQLSNWQTQFDLRRRRTDPMGRQVTASPGVTSCPSQVLGVRKFEFWVNGLMAPWSPWLGKSVIPRVSKWLFWRSFWPIFWP